MISDVFNSFDLKVDNVLPKVTFPLWLHPVKIWRQRFLVFSIIIDVFKSICPNFMFNGFHCFSISFLLLRKRPIGRNTRQTLKLKRAKS